MNCSKCGSKMVLLLFSWKCDRCDPVAAPPPIRGRRYDGSDEQPLRRSNQASRRQYPLHRRDSRIAADIWAADIWARYHAPKGEQKLSISRQSARRSSWKE